VNKVAHQLWIAWLSDQEVEKMTQEQEDDLFIALNEAWEKIKADILERG